jgi:leucyl aminopeptidase (aminopeptidase T)
MTANHDAAAISAKIPSRFPTVTARAGATSKQITEATYSATIFAGVAAPLLRRKYEPPQKVMRNIAELVNNNQYMSLPSPATTDLLDVLN